jgi:nucleotide-binding universal stress UspA family protein
MAIFARILVAFDASPPAERALVLAARLAVATGGEPGTLLVCRALELSLAVSVTDPSGEAAGSLAPIDQYRAEAQESVDRASAQASASGTRVRAFVVDGHPAEAILRLADDQHADAIAMGSHGRTGLARLVLGSTAEGVLRHANVPVIVVRDPHDEAEASGQPA